MLVVHVGAPGWSPNCWIMRLHFCVLVFVEIGNFDEVIVYLDCQRRGFIDLSVHEVQKWDAMIWQCWLFIWRHLIGGRVVGSHVFIFAVCRCRNWCFWWDSGQLWMIKSVDQLILQGTAGRNETLWFGNVDGTFGGTKLEPELLDHTIAFLLLDFDGIHQFDDVIVKLR